MYTSTQCMLLFFRKYVFQALHQSCDKSCDKSGCLKSNTMETCTEEETRVGELGLKNQKKSRLEDDQQLIVLKELDSVQKVEKTSKNKFETHLANRYATWIKRSYNS